MNISPTKPNLFVINTPYQLLNAIEAVHTLELTDNHLLIVKPKTNDHQDRFMPLIEASAWTSVSFPTPFSNGNDWIQEQLSPGFLRWYQRYLHLECMYGLAGLARRFQFVDRLFLGHYWPVEKPFMRHIANTVTYNELFLLDDGTDTIETGRRRISVEDNSHRNRPKGEAVANTSIPKRALARLRYKYWDWHLAEAPSLTFFTIYDVDELRKEDRVIRHDFRWLRSLSPSKKLQMPDTVFFLGLCISDGYLDVDTHFKMLSNAERHFEGKRIMYVAHPRESAECIDRIRRELHWDIWASTSVIEQDMTLRGILPCAVAGFVSSALISLACLLESSVDMICFHIPSEHWSKWGDYAAGVYRYLETKQQARVKIVPLTV